MRILVLGGGGREHALAWRLAQSPSVKHVFAVPGNPGLARIGQCLAGTPHDPAAMADLASSLSADLTVVGPEAPLVAGVVDEFRARRLPIVGPVMAAARLEGSKIFAKEFMARAGVPTAEFVTATTMAEALAALDRFGSPVVLKADGLAAGKGVIVARDRVEAEAAARGLLSGELVGQAGARLVIEECLTGEEVSFIVLTDGANVACMEPTQDHKAVGDADTGPNTGGMGAYRDSRILTDAQREYILDRIVHPVLAQARSEGTPYTGFLYIGLMMTQSGPKVLEFNVRLGDPETQPLMHGIEGDFGELLAAAARGDLAGARTGWLPHPSVCIVLASGGYPGNYRTGCEISGIQEAESRGAAVFHAGTREADGKLVTAGGRVLGVTAGGPTLQHAIERAYAAAGCIAFEGLYCRRDIGRKGLPRWTARDAALQ